MTNLRKNVPAAGLSLLLAGSTFAQSPAVSPSAVWRRLDWDDLIMRFAVAGMLVFLLSLVCAMIRQSFGGPDEHIHTSHPRHGFLSFLRR